jgi:cytochrome c-type biogenesis protein CcmH
MIWFWLIAASVAALTGLLVTARAAAAARAAQASEEAPAVAVHRRQLAELDELAHRGLMAGEELAAARTEAARRLLAAAETAPTPERPGSPVVRRVLALTCAGIGLAALGLYLLLGRADLPDQPYQARLAQWNTLKDQAPNRLAPQELAALLKGQAAKTPDDPRVWFMLGQAHLLSGEAGEASRAFSRAAHLAPRTPDFEIAYGEAVMSYSEGKITPDALAAFRRALAIDPANGAARYYIGRARIADGDVAGGLQDWRALAASLPPEDGHRAAVLAQIDEVQKAGGLPSPAAEAQAQVQPQAQPGGDAASGGQQAFIHAMVDRLAARLQSSPDDPDGWVRLVHSYGVLKDAKAQAAALARARSQFAKRPDVLARLEAEAMGSPAPR